MEYLLDQNILLYILLGVSLLCLILFIWVIRLEVRLRRFTVGKNGKSLERAFQELKASNDESIKFEREMSTYLKGVEERLQKSTQGVATVRFNPFSENSGNQSFATACINERGNGVVFSSIYARERTSIFAKPLVQFESEYELSAEEREALNKARENMRGNKNS